MEPILGKKKVDQIIDSVRQIEFVTNVRDLTKLITAATTFINPGGTREARMGVQEKCRGTIDEDFDVNKQVKEAGMNGSYLGLSIFILALSSCVVGEDYAADDHRPRERGRSACVDQAHDQGYRKVEVQSAQSVGPERGPGIWEVAMRAMASTGREVKLSCQYDARSRRAAVSRVD